jgi:16S rRNA (uracil1498-N3)-methyltransferase
MDLVVQKATELGVTRIVPVNTEFSVVKLDAATIERKRAHWQAIAIGACEQSGRNRIPHIEAPCELSTALQIAAAFAPTRLVLDAEAKLPLASLPRTTTQAALLIGPEGGLSDKEIRHAGSAGFESRSIGPRILRTETAALTALAVLQSVAGDFR